MMTPEEKAENELIWNCPNRAVPIQYAYTHPITGEIYGEDGYENRCGPQTAVGKHKERCNRCGKTMTYGSS